MLRSLDANRSAGCDSPRRKRLPGFLVTWLPSASPLGPNVCVNGMFFKKIRVYAASATSSRTLHGHYERRTDAQETQALSP